MNNMKEEEENIEEIIAEEVVEETTTEETISLEDEESDKNIENLSSEYKFDFTYSTENVKLTLENNPDITIEELHSVYPEFPDKKTLKASINLAVSNSDDLKKKEETPFLSAITGDLETSDLGTHSTLNLTSSKTEETKVEKTTVEEEDDEFSKELIEKYSLATLEHAQKYITNPWALPTEEKPDELFNKEAYDALLLIKEKGDKDKQTLDNITSKWPALKKLDNIVLNADESYDMSEYGAGTIEYHSPDQGDITYAEGVSITHPSPGSHAITYNPNLSNEQSIRLDMLHGMHSIPEYKELYDKFKESFTSSKFIHDIKESYKKKKEEGYLDSYEHHERNEIDGIIRNLLFEGTSEEFEKSKYWEEASKTYLSDENIKTSFNELKTYLETGGEEVEEVEEITTDFNADKFKRGINTVEASGNMDYSLVSKLKTKAIGPYQFIYSHWKEVLKDEFGVNSREDFIGNKEAQEGLMDYLLEDKPGRYTFMANALEKKYSEQIKELGLSHTDLMGMEHFVGHGEARKLFAKVRDGEITKEEFFETIPGGLNNSIGTYLEKYRGGMVEETEGEETGFISPEDELLDYITVRKQQQESTLTASVDPSFTTITDPVDWEYLYLKKSTALEYTSNPNDYETWNLRNNQQRELSSILNISGDYQNIDLDELKELKFQNLSDRQKDAILRYLNISDEKYNEILNLEIREKGVIEKTFIYLGMRDDEEEELGSNILRAMISGNKEVLSVLDTIMNSLFDDKRNFSFSSSANMDGSMIFPEGSYYRHQQQKEEYRVKKEEAIERGFDEISSSDQRKINKVVKNFKRNFKVFEEVGKKRELKEVELDFEFIENVVGKSEIWEYYNNPNWHENMNLNDKDIRNAPKNVIEDLQKVIHYCELEILKIQS